MSRDLKPCNNASGHQLEIEEFIPNVFRVVCGCGRKGSTAETKEQAILLWGQMNTRPSTPASDIEELRQNLIINNIFHNEQVEAAEIRGAEWALQSVYDCPVDAFASNSKLGYEVSFVQDLKAASIVASHHAKLPVAKDVKP